MQTLNNLDQLQGLIATLEIQENQKRDYIAPGKQLFFLDGKLVTSLGDKSVTYEPSQHFHNQMAEKMNIPVSYYNKMLGGAKKLLDSNVNHWINQESKNFLVRTFEKGLEGNIARAFLSDRYGVMDNYSILMEALESIKETGVEVQIVNAELSDTRMYLKIVCPGVEVQANEMLKSYRLSLERGMGVISGFVLQNSEIGAGAFSISPRAVVLACTNGLVMTKDSLKNVHLGAKMDELGFNQNQNVMRANLKLIKEQIKHAVKIFLSKDYLNKLINVYTAIGEPMIEAPIDKVIQVVGKRYDINEERKANLLKYFVEGGDRRRIGLANALTFECQSQEADTKHNSEVSSYDMLQDFNKIEAEAFKLKKSSN